MSGGAWRDLICEAALIDGEWLAGDELTVFNPATGARLGGAPDFGEVEAERAVLAAQAAGVDWARRSAKERSAVLRTWFEAIVRRQDDLAALLTAEQGKPLAEAKAEIAYGASFVEWFSEEAKRVYGETIPGPQADKRSMVLKRPVGVVGAITPWNFPAAMITRKVAPALAAGCTVVLKPSELTPFTALALARLAQESGVPPGVFNVVTGDAAAIGRVLTNHPAVAKFTFTGSTAVGKLLTAQCASTMKRVSMELGGNAPFIVFEDADLERAVEGVIAAKFRNTGQTCVSANRLLVHDAVHDRFAEMLTARAEAFVIGDGLAGLTHQGPLISVAAARKVAEHVDDAVRKGAQVLTGGRAHPAGEAFYRPTVLAGAAPSMRLAQEETFGPVAPIFRFSTEEQAVGLANATRSGLAAYAFTRDLDRFWRLADALQAGMIGINTGAISSEMAPFGGVKESGLGREGARQGMEEFLDLKMICTGLAA